MSAAPSEGRPFCLLDARPPGSLSPSSLGSPAGPCPDAHLYIHQSMTFGWDPGKADASRRKHGVDFADAVGSLRARTPSAEPTHSPAEERVATLGRRYAEDVDA